MRGSTNVLAVSALIFIEWTRFCVSFSIAPKSFLTRPSTFLSTEQSSSEFSLLDTKDEYFSNDIPKSDYVVVNQSEDKGEMSSSLETTTSKRPEYGAMAPGTVVQVQIGDLSLARKAWKKRRRTGSPLLVPCSILSVDQRSMVRWNLIFLLEKFGIPKADGIQISSNELVQRYRTFLKSSLQRQSSALGFESSDEMIMDLFNKKVQESYGVRLVELNDGQLVLKAPISRTKALKRASRTPVLQFRAPKPGDNNGELKALTHTGFLRSRKATQDASDRSYHFLPLSAALRVSQKDDVDTGRIEVGSIHPAVVFDYDLAGDAGSPLITLSLNPRGIRENLKVKPDRKYEPIENPQHVFQDLKVGDGPFRAKVIRLQQGRALIDMDVGRRLPSEGMVKVLGILPFQASVQIRSSSTVVTNTDDDDDDVEDYDYEDEFGTLEDALFSFDDDDDGEVEEEDDEEEDSLADELLSLRSSESFDDDTFEDDEEEEDISSLYQVNDDGDLTYVDPDTGKMIVMRPDDYDEHDEEEAFEEDDDEDDSVVASLAGEGDDDEDNDNIDTNDDDNDDGDIDFDMSTLFKENDDGSVSFIDPDSGEALEVESGDEEYEDMMMIKSLIDEYTRPPSPKNVDYTYSEEEPSLSKEKKVNQPSPILVSKRLRVGEEVEVFIRTVSKQSGQFTVTTNPTVQGRKAKDLKREGHAIKKLDRLKKSLGGSLQKIWELEGQECFGIVKATSQSGEWCYVQPDLKDLPVGVATLVSGSDAHFSAGDSVRVRIAGVDEERGQLAMHLLGKV